MIPGYPVSSPIGDTDDHIQLSTEMIGKTVISCKAFAKTGYGGFNWAIFSNGVFHKVIFVAEGVATLFTIIPFDWKKTKHSISVEPVGNWAQVPPETAVGKLHQDYEEAFGDTVLAQWEANQNFQVFEDLTNAFSSWVLTGLRRSFNCETADLPTRGKLQLTLTQSGGVNTVTLKRSTVTIASGTRVGNGSVTLTESNDSGVSGSVTVAYTSDVTAELHIRWPKSYELEIDATTFEKNDNGLSNKFERRIDGLDSDTYSLTVTPMSDTGIEHTPTVEAGIVVAAVPEPPTDIVLNATPGDNTATIIDWTASDTSAVQYYLYDSAINEPTDITNSIANTALLTFTLPSIGAAAGTRHVIIEARKAGIESGIRNFIAIEYDSSGTIIQPRPNKATYFVDETTNGKTVSFKYNYDRLNEKAPATKLAVFLVTEANLAAFDATGVADKEIALDAGTDRIFGNDSIVSVADGVYFIFVLAETAAGSRSILDKAKGVRLWLDSDVEAAVTVDAEVAI